MPPQIKTPIAPSPNKNRDKKKTPAKPRLLSSKLVYKGKVFSVVADKVQEPGGGIHTREIVRHHGSVVILAVDESKSSTDPEIIFERQYRHAVGRFLIELPAGRVEPHEPPLASAKRELTEETGYRAKRWTLLTKYFASPGFVGEWMQIYLARDIRGGTAAPEPDENIEVFRLTLSEAMALIAANKIQDGKTLIGLMLYDAALKAGRF
jgi:ADP-ribose pyrophosphatase